MKDLIYLKNVASLHLDIARCAGCGMCLDVCPHDVFVMQGKTAAIVRRDACMECGACSRNCPAGALAVAAGVGCATAFLNGLLGRNGGECCCGPATPDGGSAGCC
ncbi:MAG: 4Fe-4S dicluster domain-containing protein [Deltaproteobacteria bacterium]|jgi:NAD-dependent dihydropyrimidine dehydrogenase PreA subunit|nr:4Fe-4S dicluster domain-containing protein [Syntrophaceae bacterium]